MKNLIFVMIFSLSSASFAGDIIGGGGGTLKFERNEIEALVTPSGDYARFEDLADGFVQFEGAIIQGESVFLDLKNPRLEVDTVLFSTGTARHLSGGDMGGGGRIIQ